MRRKLTRVESKNKLPSPRSTGGEVREMVTRERVLCLTEDGERDGVTWRRLRSGCQRRWSNGVTELTEPAAERCGRVAVKPCPSQREEEDGPDARALGVSGTTRCGPESRALRWSGRVKTERLGSVSQRAFDLEWTVQITRLFGRSRSQRSRRPPDLDRTVANWCGAA